MSTTFTPDSPVTVTDTYIKGPETGQYPNGQNTMYLQLANAIYFNGTNLLIGFFNEKAKDNSVRTKLTISELLFSATEEGSYAVVPGSIITQVDLSPWLSEAYVFFALTPAILGDKLYIFILNTDQQTVVSIEVSPTTDRSSLTMRPAGNFKLPEKTNIMSAAAVGDKIHLYYPISGNTSVIGRTSFWQLGNGVTNGDNKQIAVGSGPQGQITTLSASQVPVDGTLLNITDSRNNTFTLIEKDGSATGVKGIQSGSNTPAGQIPAIVSGNGPALGQTAEASMLYYGIGIGGTTPINCLQASLDDRTITGDIGIIGSTQPVPITSIFTTDMYCKLPGEQHGSLFRASLVGIMSLEVNSLKLYIVATGSMIAQDPVKTITSSGIHALSPQMQEVYYRTYTLIGILQSPPPFLYYDQPIASSADGLPEIEVKLSEEDSAEITQESKTSFSAGGSGGNSIISVGGSVGHALSNSTSNTATVTVGSTFHLHSEANPPGVNMGKLLVSVPHIENTAYKLFAPGGSNTGYKFYMIEVKKADVLVLEYDNQNPDDNIYSKGLNVVSHQQDIVGWQTNPIPDSVPTSTDDLSPMIAGHHGSQQSQLQNDHKEGISSSTKTDISINAGINIGAFGFKASTSVSWQNDSTAYTTLHKGYSANLPGLRVLTNPASNTIKSYTLSPHLYHLTPENVGSNTGLIPDIFEDQSPWVITWKVTDIEYY